MLATGGMRAMNVHANKRAMSVHTCVRSHQVTLCYLRRFCETYHLSVGAYAQLVNDFPDFRNYVEAVARLRLGNLLKSGGAVFTVSANCDLAEIQVT